MRATILARACFTSRHGLFVCKGWASKIAKNLNSYFQYTEAHADRLPKGDNDSCRYVTWNKGKREREREREMD